MRVHTLLLLTQAPFQKRGQIKWLGDKPGSRNFKALSQGFDNGM